MTYFSARSAVNDAELAVSIGQLHAALADCRSLQQVVAELVRALPTLLPVSDRVSLALLGPAGGTLRVVRVLPKLDVWPSELPVVHSAESVVAQVARDGQARCVVDVRQEDAMRFGHASHDGIRSTLSLPLKAAGRVVGVFNLGSKRVGACHLGMIDRVLPVCAGLGCVLAALSAPGLGVPPLAAPNEPWVGDSPPMRRLLQMAERVAKSAAPVLITGETGVGKSRLARLIHDWSDRRRAPFSVVHLADLPPTLVESELFGHERGAFTGAIERRRGRFELADGGSLFLDEIGETPLPIQTKLLRFTQEGRFERVGGNATLSADVRILAATHRDLHAAAEAGEFRRDLLYRLDIVALHVPPLRERAADIEPLATALVARLAQEHGRPLRLRPSSLLRLRNHDWPGNVRQLEAALLRATLLEEGDDLALDSLPPSQSATGRAEPGQWPTRDEHERTYLRRVLAHVEGRIEGRGGAARLVGLAPSTLRSRLKRLGIDVAETAVGGNHDA